MKALRRVRVDAPLNVEGSSPERLEFLDRLYQERKQSVAADEE